MFLCGKWTLVVLLVALAAKQGFCDKHLVMVGGGLADNNTDIYGTIVRLAGGIGVARIGLFTVTSADPADSAAYYTQLFTQYGCKEVTWIPITVADKQKSWDLQVAELVKNQTGFFFGGGDQSRAIEALFGANRVASPVLLALREKFNGGSVVAGSSAGTMCIPGSVMITGGMSYEALRYGAKTQSNSADDLTYDPQGGLGLLDGIVLDTHFSERGREGRLIRLLGDTRGQSRGTNIGVGVDEDTAAVFTIGSTVRVEAIGTSGVVVADISDATIRPATTGNTLWSIDRVRMHYLTTGDTMNLNTGHFTVPSWKQSLLRHEYYTTASDSTDIFNRRRRTPPEFVRISTRLFDSQSSSAYGLTYESNPTIKVYMSKRNPGAEGFGGRKPGDPDKKFIISYKDLSVDIYKY